jgi:hypothetical protein
MNEQEFWDLVDSIGWGTKTTDNDVVRKRLLNELTPEQMEQMREHFSEFQGQLYELAEEIDIENVSDDGLSDLTAHIVGLGKAEFERHVNSPKEIQVRANLREYTESFSYCIPSPDDLVWLDVASYQKRAAQERKLYETIMCDDPHLEDIQGDLNTICMALEIMEGGEWQAFLTYEKKVKKALDNIKRHFESMDKDMAALGYVPSCDMSNNVRNPWGVLNLFGDVKTYLLN